MGRITKVVSKWRKWSKWLFASILMFGLTSSVHADQATLVVDLPEDATLTIEGGRTKATGSRRIFHSPQLEAGKVYEYHLVAKLETDDYVVRVRVKVEVRSGRTSHVDLNDLFERAIRDIPKQKRLLDAVRDYIEDEEWLKAFTVLQSVFDSEKSDVDVEFVYRDVGWTYVSKECNMMFMTLPRAGFDFYETNYGTRAADALKQIKQTGDYGKLTSIVNSYRYTQAGKEALLLLADYHLDRGHYSEAVVCYDRFFEHPDAGSHSAEVLAKRYLALRMADEIQQAKEIWLQLCSKTAKLHFGNKDVNVKDFQRYVDGLAGSNLASGD